MPKRSPPSPPASPLDSPKTELRVDLIDLSGHNPRRSFDPDAMAELKASIQAHGILEPLIVRPRLQGCYELVAGERRLRAAQELGLESVPVVVRELSDAEALECMLLENLQRQDLEPLEEAHALADYLEVNQVTQEALGRKIGKSQAWVANRLRLLGVPESVQQLLISRQITPKHVLALQPWTAFPALFPRLVEELQANIEEGNPFTAEGIADMAEEVVSQASWERDEGEQPLTFRLDRLDYKDHLLSEFLDRQGCVGCAKLIEFESARGSGIESSWCTDGACYASKLGKAREALKAHQLELAKQRDPEAKVDPSQLSLDGDYYRRCLDYKDFDKAECNGCAKCVSKPNRAEPRKQSLYCLDEACMEKKEKELRAKVRQEAADAWNKLMAALDRKTLPKHGANPVLTAKFKRMVLARYMNYGDAQRKGVRMWGQVRAQAELRETIASIPTEDLDLALVRVIALDVVNERIRYSNARPSVDMLDKAMEEERPEKGKKGRKAKEAEASAEGGDPGEGESVPPSEELCGDCADWDGDECMCGLEDTLDCPNLHPENQAEDMSRPEDLEAK